jgi:signal transduction histidine kinase
MSALSELVESTEIIHGVRCRLRTQSDTFEADHLTAVQLYRITQEAVHNALRHGQARNIEISLTSRDHEHRLTIADDGKGFDAELLRRTAQSGLRMMEYRANMIGGALSVDSQPGLGTRIICTFSTGSLARG